jgi:hypothetical protein
MVMDRKRITCPETAHLEEVDLERTPYGHVIAGCSRFQPACAVQCAGECARRLDRRDRRDTDDLGERVLVVYADASRTRPIALALAEALVGDRLTVDIADADTHAAPPPADYDAIVIGTAIRFTRYSSSAIDYIAEHRDALVAMPSFLFFVNPTGTADEQALVDATGWCPTRSFGFARPHWSTRWFGEPQGQQTPRIRELAEAIVDEIPALEIEARATV